MVIGADGSGLCHRSKRSQHSHSHDGWQVVRVVKNGRCQTTMSAQMSWARIAKNWPPWSDSLKSWTAADGASACACASGERERERGDNEGAWPRPSEA